jgi:di/tricarboxylate transporter
LRHNQENRIKNNVLGKMSPFKTDHNLILWKLEKKRNIPYTGL